MLSIKGNIKKEIIVNLLILYKAVRFNGLKGRINGAGLKTLELCA